ncbi:MAG TPA: tetratricopeptide repeat protein, partial [Dehalococcoidia bacterium]|nr:tetratricopeptide repeat protein [Dehalococcoidia bacterium]
MVIAESQLGWSLLQSGKWPDARTAFESALSRESCGETLHGLADTLWWSGDLKGSIEYYQEAFAAYREEGNTLGAATAAFSLAMTYKCCLGNDAAASGWLGRAQSVAEEGDPTLIQGWLWSFQAYMAVDKDLDEAERYNAMSLAFAAKTGDRDLELVVNSTQGVVEIMRGRVEEGIRLIDESMAALSVGENKRALTFVIVCCAMLIACELIADIRRARDWFHIGERFMAQFENLYLFAECRMTYGGTLFALGQWARAERELISAVRETQDVYIAMNSMGRARLARLYISRGELEAAEEVLAGIENEIWALPPLAGLKLAQGDPSTALSLIDRYWRLVDHKSMANAIVLQLQVSAHLALDDRDGAAAALAQLKAMAAEHGWQEVSARAHMASGSFAMASNDFGGALACFERAMTDFSSLGMAYESARARFAAATILAATNPSLAAIEAEGTRTVFEKLGARPDADAAAALLRNLGVATRPGPRTGSLLSRREEEVLALLSQGLSNP